MRAAKLNEDAIIPTRKHETDAGIDLYSSEDRRITPNSSYIVHTGITVEIPKGCFGLIYAKSRSDFLIGGGIIDQDYQGEILVKVVNYTDRYLDIVLGQPIAQLLIIPCLTPKIEPVSSLYIHQTKTERAATGGIVEQVANFKTPLTIE